MHAPEDHDLPDADGSEEGREDERKHDAEDEIGECRCHEGLHIAGAPENAIGDELYGDDGIEGGDDEEEPPSLGKGLGGAAVHEHKEDESACRDEEDGGCNRECPLFRGYQWYHCW